MNNQQACECNVILLHQACCRQRAEQSPSACRSKYDDLLSNPTFTAQPAGYSRLTASYKHKVLLSLA